MGSRRGISRVAAAAAGDLMIRPHAENQVLDNGAHVSALGVLRNVRCSERLGEKKSRRPLVAAGRVFSNEPNPGKTRPS